MAKERIHPDMMAYGRLISASNRAGDGQAADAWLQRALKDGIRPDKACSLESAKHAFFVCRVTRRVIIDQCTVLFV